jgi:hypothetical protein
VTFEGSVDGVQAFVQLFNISATSKPAANEVAGFIAEMDARVDVLIGTLTSLPAERQAVFITAGRALVHLGAAAMTYDSSAPETVRGSGNYGEVLWQRWYADADRLAKAAQQARSDAAAGSSATGVGVASVFGNRVEIPDSQVW